MKKKTIIGRFRAGVPQTLHLSADVQDFLYNVMDYFCQQIYYSIDLK